MRRAALRLLLGAFPTVAAAQAPESAAPAAPALAEAKGPAQTARDAYNAGKYPEAAAGFLAAVQASPRDAELYRALARARVWAKDGAGAIIAYRFYLELAAGAPDREKVEAELANALKLVAAPPPAGPPAGAAKLMAEAVKRGAAGDTAGALDSAAEALKKGYFAPDLAETQAALIEPLARAFAAELERFASLGAVVDAAALERLVQAYGRIEKGRPLNAAESAARGGAAGLAAFKAARWEDAVTALLPHAPSDPRLRVALALSLLRLGRAEEAAQGLESLNSDDRQVQLLLGLCKAAAGQDPTAALKRALDL